MSTIPELFWQSGAWSLSANESGWIRKRLTGGSSGFSVGASVRSFDLARSHVVTTVRCVDAVLPLDQMSTAEKLRAMEALWADLTRTADTFESPAWHEDVLRERDQRVAEGKEVYVSWDEAKRELRDRLQ